MKTGLYFLLASVPFLFWACTEIHEPDLTGNPWKFKSGDNLLYAEVSFNDSSWQNIDPTKVWDDQGYKEYDGIGWYRTSFHLSGQLKKYAEQDDSVQVFLGKIDDCDQVFLNGNLIGENGITIKDLRQPDSNFIKGRNIWNMQRRYILSLQDPRLKWDSLNFLAIRCYDHGGLGGVYDKRFGLSVTGIKDYISIDAEAFPFITVDSSVTKTLVLQNISGKREYQGTLTIAAIESKTGSTVYKEKAGVLLTPGARLEKTITFSRGASVPARLQVSFKQKNKTGEVFKEIEVPYILTPKTGPAPKINSPSVFGFRPYSNCFFKVAATGEKPLTFSVSGLPQGLNFHPATGVISGMLRKKGDFKVEIKVENTIGAASQTLTLLCGDLISLTPPMGWNSWNCWGLSVSDAKVRESVKSMVSSGLIDHGWSFINIDDGWQDKHDREGNILPNSKFPDMYGLVDFIHSQGLKAGIYSSPGPKTCGGYEGSYKFEEKDAAQYARWGIDYLKYDWCSYFSIAPDPTPEDLRRPYKEMRHALRKTNRDIHYSLCQYGMGDVWKWGHEVDGNSWRTTGDIEDTWESVSTIGFGQHACAGFGGPGRWNDPDMLVVGWVGWGPNLHYTRLTPDEQYMHISLWSLLASPLLLGNDLSRLDEFTMNLLTNDEVLSVNQDPLGQQATRVYCSQQVEIWSRDLADGRKAVGLFNKTSQVIHIPVDMHLLCIEGKWMMRDLWKQQDLGLVKGHFEMKTQPHGVRLVTLMHPPEN